MVSDFREMVSVGSVGTGQSGAVTQADDGKYQAHDESHDPLTAQVTAQVEQMVEFGWLERTIPDKPTSRFQKYRLTAKGHAWLVNAKTAGKRLS